MISREKKERERCESLIKDLAVVYRVDESERISTG